MHSPFCLTIVVFYNFLEPGLLEQSLNLSLAMTVYHLPKNSGNLCQNVNGKTLLGRPTGNFAK